MQHTDLDSLATMHDGHFEINTVETRHPRRAAPPSPAGRDTYPPCNIAPNRAVLGFSPTSWDPVLNGFANDMPVGTATQHDQVRTL